MRYPGGKNGAGVYQHIINQMPPHSVYIEAFAGSAAVLRHKLPARESIAIDIDARSTNALFDLKLANTTVFRMDALKFLREYPFTPHIDLMYLDPPYLMSTRSCKQPIYEHDFSTEEEHIELLSLITTMHDGVKIMISGYPSKLYDEHLAAWRTFTFSTTNRRGALTTEKLWMNYPVPVALHDYRYLGAGFRERERIKRKMNRWTARLTKMPLLERYAMLAALEGLK